MVESSSQTESNQQTAAYGTGSGSPGVAAVGVGPGDPEYLTARARSILAAADVVVGFETVVAIIEDVTEATLLACDYETQTDMLATFGAHVADGATGVAVLVGDPNVSGYQFLTRVEEVVDDGVRVVPGISSIQIAASRARTPLDESTVVSLHRRGSIEGHLSRLVTDAGDRHLLVLPRPYDTMPEDIAAHLVDAGVDPSLSAVVYERLTHETESVTRETLATLARDESTPSEGTRFSDLSVMVVDAPAATDTSAMPTEEQS